MSLYLIYTIIIITTVISILSIISIITIIIIITITIIITIITIVALSKKLIILTKSLNRALGRVYKNLKSNMMYLGKI
jgi:hypothetical protein